MAAFASASACTLLSMPDTEQCDQHADCARFGPAVQCVRHLCVAPSGPAAPDASPPDASAQQDAAEPALDASAQCRTLSDCDDSKPHICRAGACVSLTSDECTAVVPAAAVRDDSVFVGFMAPVRGDFASVGIPIEQGAALAHEELESHAKGLPLGPGNARRKLVMVACHDFDDPLRAARHLIETVRVPAILGPALSGVVLDVATELSVGSGTLLLSPSATSPALTDLGDAGLVWRTAPSDAIQAVPLAALVTRQEERIRLEQGLTSADSIRVAVAAKGEAYGQGLFAALSERIRFNGLSAAENGADFLPISYPDPSQGEVDYAAYVQAIVDFEPHIVVLLGTAEVVTELLAPIEASWPVGPFGAPRPYYLVPDGGRDPSLLTLVGEDLSLSTRVRGTVPGQKGDAYDSFALRYRARYDSEPGTFADAAYDASYLLAYAITFASDSELTGARIAAGLAQLSAGERVLSGPTDINAALTLMQAGMPLDFEGALGSLDFDATTGEAPTDIEIWCVTADAGAAAFQSSGEYYDAKLLEIVGDNVDCDF